MKFQFLLGVVFLAASGNALPKMSECETDCEKTYKYCSTSGKGSERACHVQREKCRKACIKKEKAAAAA